MKFLNKRGGMGLTDFFSVLALAFIFLIFYLLLKFTAGKSTFQITEQSADFDNYLSLLNILRTPVILGGTETNIAEVIALSEADSEMEASLKNNITKILDEFDASDCLMLCIDGKKFKGSGCSKLGYYRCSAKTVYIPTHQKEMIEVSLSQNE